MSINIEVFGSLETFTGFKSKNINIDRGSTIENVKKMIGIPVNYPCVVLVNNIYVKTDKKLNNNESVKFLMNISGG